MEISGPRPDLTIVSARDAAFANSATLVDVIDARRWRCGHCVLELPPDHMHVSLRSPDGAELRCALVSEKTPLSGGELRLLLIEAAEHSTPPFRLTPIAARGDFERLARDQIIRSGARLVWAIAQRRQVERLDGAAALVRLSPASRAFPTHQSRIVLESIETLVGRGSPLLKAPFAIMENWLRENGAPCPALRIRIPNAPDQNAFMLSRTAVVLVLHQRRRFREWLRERRDAGEPVADPLDGDDIGQATGYPPEWPDIVEAEGSIVVHNLLSVLANVDTAAFDGLSVTRLEGGAEAGAVVDLHFFGATLGDDVGLVSTTADAGDFGVVPRDPGGAPYVRLFRVESDGLKPRKVGDDDMLLDELLRCAADAERGVTAAPARPNGERATSAQGRREKLLASFNASLATAGYVGRFEASRLWDIFEPLLMSSFVALAEDAAPDARAILSRIGGYDAYRRDPSLAQAVMRRSELAKNLDEQGFGDYCGAAISLPRRFAGACRILGLIAESAETPAEIEIWRLSAQPFVAPRVAKARIALAGDEDAEGVAHVAELLLEEAIVERAAIYCDDLGLQGEAQALRDYLAHRRNGEWIAFDAASRLAVIVEEANRYWRQIDVHHAEATREEPRVETEARPEGLLATMRNFLLRGSRGLRS